jgi:pre-mRNA 3'-end-processing factor FIP1
LTYGAQPVPSFPFLYPISLSRPTRPAPRNANSTPQKGIVAFFPEFECHTQCLGTVPAPGPSLTTEYTPRERGGLAKPPAAQPTPTGTPSSKPLATPNIATPAPAPAPAAVSTPDVKPYIEDGPDPSTFPPVTAPPSHPAIDPTATGMLEGRPVFEVDMAALADKAWRRPGSDISDWFNYGFDEISWEAYCYRRRELGDLAAVLKTNVVVRSLPSLACNLYSKCSFVMRIQNFSGMPEDQLTQLPPDIRTMVMTGATAMMANGGGPMMQPGMNSMMGPEMGNMNMGPQMMDPMMAGMGGEMGMDGVGVGVGVGAPQQGQGGPMPDQMGAGVEGFGPQGGMGVGMGIPDYGIQVRFDLPSAMPLDGFVKRGAN